MKNRKVFNFTGHEINYREFTIPSHGNIRVEERVSLGEPANSMEYGEIPIGHKVFGEIVGIPQWLDDPENEGSIVIVSFMVLAALERKSHPVLDKHCVVAPDTGKSCVRDENGKIKYVVQFIAQGGEK
jgi:hypothetical protein